MGDPSSNMQRACEVFYHSYSSAAPVPRMEVPSWHANLRILSVAEALLYEVQASVARFPLALSTPSKPC